MEYISKIKNKFNRTLLFILTGLFPFASQADLVPFEIKVHGTIYYFLAKKTSAGNVKMIAAIDDLNSLLAKQKNYCQSCELFAIETYPTPNTNLRKCRLCCLSAQDDIQLGKGWNCDFGEQLSNIYTEFKCHSDFSVASAGSIILHKGSDSNSESMKIEKIKPNNPLAVLGDNSSVQTATALLGSLELDSQQSLKQWIDQNDDEALEKIKNLIGTNPECVNSNSSYSPIAHAATQHNNEIFNFILSRVRPNEDGSEYVLWNICQYMEGEQRINRCQGLLDAKWNFIPNGDYSLLEILANDKALDFSFLFDKFSKQCQINYSDKDNFWFFASLLKSGNTGMIRYILNKQDNFDPTLTDFYHSSYITVALQFGLINIACELLARYPEAARIPSSLHGTPLQTMSSPLFVPHQASVEGYKKVITLLIQHEAKINEATTFQPSTANLSDVSRTPLQLAIDHLNVNYIQALLECDANPKDVQSGEPNLLQLTAAAFLKYKAEPLECSKAINILKLLNSHFKPCEWCEKNADKMSAMDYISQHSKSKYILKQLKLTKTGEPEADTPTHAMEI